LQGHRAPNHGGEGEPDAPDVKLHMRLLIVASTSGCLRRKLGRDGLPAAIVAALEAFVVLRFQGTWRRRSTVSSPAARPAAEGRRSLPIEGRAMFMIDASRTTTNWATASSASASQRRGSGMDCGWGGRGATRSAEQAEARAVRRAADRARGVDRARRRKAALAGGPAARRRLLVAPAWPAQPRARPTPGLDATPSRAALPGRTGRTRRADLGRDAPAVVFAGCLSGPESSAGGCAIHAWLRNEARLRCSGGGLRSSPASCPDVSCRRRCEASTCRRAHW
jgi:hypothetical protein